MHPSPRKGKTSGFPLTELDKFRVGLRLFFSPGAEDFAKNYQGRSCPLPTGHLAIFSGGPNALKALKLSAQ